jgi:hypothetical protein
LSDSWWADAIDYYLSSDMQPFIIPRLYEELELVEQIWAISKDYGMEPEV